MTDTRPDPMPDLTEAITGVVMPDDPETVPVPPEVKDRIDAAKAVEPMTPEPSIQSPFTATKEQAVAALATVRSELAAKREFRRTLNAEIKVLVDDEDVLRRMVALAEKPREKKGEADDAG